MYILLDVAKANREDKLRAAARHQLQNQAYAARRARRADGPARRPAVLRVLRVLRAAHAY